MTERAWTVTAEGVVLAALVCLALSSQFMLQRDLYAQWSLGQVLAGWAGHLALLGTAAAVALLTIAAAGRLPVRRPIARLALFAVALVGGAFLGEWVVLWIQWGDRPAVGVEALLPYAMRWVPVGAAVAVILRLRRHAGELAVRLHDAELTRLQLERQQVEVQLQVLQSQIEPHFLFNTLATVRRLYQTDPPRGRETLSGFIHYLRASLPQMRQRETTLGQELDLIVAYLDVLRVRMGERLKVMIDVDPVLRSRRLPPLSLATLVENAIKHGLASLPEGGTIEIRAWLDGDRLKVRVADTGVGLNASGGSGMGLANLRVRLRGLYGDDAALRLQPNAPQGLAATLELPGREHGPA